jgi:hypothetical protein
MSSRKPVIALAAVAIVCWTTGIILENTDNGDLLIAKVLFFGWTLPLLVLVALAAAALAGRARGRNT